ncbi:MAG: hypothetical protein FWD12_08265, partial [Alphaproteobacteria bacterium]|nr:hypothetical protein [Alphaproteobacteria bacterium]
QKLLRRVCSMIEAHDACGDMSRAARSEHSQDEPGREKRGDHAALACYERGDAVEDYKDS